MLILDTLAGLNKGQENIDLRLRTIEVAIGKLEVRVSTKALAWGAFSGVLAVLLAVAVKWVLTGAL